MILTPQETNEFHELLQRHNAGDRLTRDEFVRLQILLGFTPSTSEEAAAFEYDDYKGDVIKESDPAS